jgi:hypothetical protein
MSAPPRRAAVIVVAQHRPAALRRLLVGLRHPVLELVVVTVGDDPAWRRAARGAVVLSASADRDAPGRDAVLRAAVAAVSSPIVVVADDGVLLGAPAALGLVEAVRRGADAAVPRILDPHAGAARPAPGSASASTAASGVVAARRELLEAVPLLDDDAGPRLDRTWLRRVRQSGARVEYPPDATCSAVARLAPDADPPRRVARPTRARPRRVPARPNRPVGVPTAGPSRP